MKWYKHISDSLDDPFIFELMELYGADGYLVFFGILEIYSREFKPELNWNLSVTHAYLRQKLHKRQDTLVIKILKHIQNSGKWDIQFKDNKVIIFIPKFTELIDEWSRRKLRSDSVVTPKILKTDKEEDKEVRIKNNIKEGDKPPRPIKSFVKPTLQEVTTYCRERHNTVSPQVFLNHYESNGWMVGKNKMKDWKAAVRTWETRGDMTYGTKREGTTGLVTVQKEYVPEPFKLPTDDEIKRNIERANEIVKKLAG